jgi:hypothetical protein
MFAPRFIALAVFGPRVVLDSDLAGNPLDERFRYRQVAGQRIPRITQQTELHRETESVRIAPALPN